MHNKKGPQFLTEPSDSSLLHDQGYRKRFDSPRTNDKLEKPGQKTPKFVDKRSVLPDKLTNAVVFNSKGEKRDASNLFELNESGYKITDCESVHVAASANQLADKRDCVDSYLGASQSGIDNYYSTTQETIANPVVNLGVKKPHIRQPLKRSRTKLSMSRKKRSKTEVKPQTEHNSKNKETYTESVSQSNVSTQTDIKYVFCRKCLQQNTTKHSVDAKNSIPKLETKSVKPSSAVGGDSKQNAMKPTNAFCTAVNVTPPPSNAYNVGDTSYEVSGTASATDVMKSKRASMKRHLVEKNEAIHQEIMKLKKSVESKNNTQLSVLNGTSPLASLGKPSHLYCKIKKANRNGSLRFVLSMLIFAILLFWLFSAIFHFDLVLEIFRTIGRHLSSFPIFITRRKKELSTAEILIKYVASLGRVLKGIVTGEH